MSAINSSNRYFPHGAFAPVIAGGLCSAVSAYEISRPLRTTSDKAKQNSDHCHLSLLWIEKNKQDSWVGIQLDRDQLTDRQREKSKQEAKQQ